jgi:hypothetical protein
MSKQKVWTGNKATGYTTTNNGIVEQTNSEAVARRTGVIKDAVPTWALCCGWSKNKK